MLPRISKLFSDIVWVIRLGFAASPWFAFLSTFLLFAAAIIPAVNVEVVRLISQRIEDSNSPFVFIVLCGVIFGFGSALTQVVNALSRMHALRIDTYANDNFDTHLAKSEPRAYESAEYMKRVRNARSSLTQGYPSSQFQATILIFCALMTAVSLALALWSYSPSAAIVSLFAPVPTAIAYGWYGKQESRLWPVSSEHLRKATYIEDQIAYSGPGFELALMRSSELFAELAKKSRLQYKKVRFHLESLSIVSDGLSGLVTTVLFCLALVFLYQDSGHSASAIFAGLVGLISGVSAMAGVGYQIGELLISVPANRHLRSFLELERSSSEEIKKIEIDAISAKNVSVHYDDVQAVKDVSMTFQSGQLVAIVGENGSGKTSFLKAVMNAQPKASGSVHIDHQALGLSETTSWQYPFAVLNQDFQRHELTVRQFVTLCVPDHRQTDQLIWDALKTSGAAGFVSQMKDQLDTALGTQWDGADLSGGQWQRLAIARVVLSDAPVWFLDEPTSAIDALGEELVFAQLAAKTAGRIIVLTSHRVSALKYADQIHVLQHGELVESGTFTQLLNTDSEFHKMFAAQLQVSSGHAIGQ